MSKKDDKLQDDIVDEYQKATIELYKVLLASITPYMALKKEKKLYKELKKELKLVAISQIKTVEKLLTYVCLHKIKDKRIIKKIIKENWSGERFSDRIYKEKKLLEKVLKRELKNSLINGEATEEIIKRVTKKLDTSVFNARRLMDTEVSNVMSKTELKRGEAKGHRYYRIIVEMDDRTSPICQEIHNRNETFVIGNPIIYGVNFVPAHPFCRSRIETF